MRVVILAGGMGSRLQEQTSVRPKPMVEIGHRPMLWHIMKIYAAHGFREFVLALGYKAEMVREYFFDFHRLHRNVSIDLRDGAAIFHDDACDDWRVHLVDTGLETQTGGRLRRLRPWLGTQPFMLTYGDGVANVDIGEAGRLPPGPRQAGDRHRRAPAGPLRRPPARRRPRGRVRGEAADRRGLDQRRLLRASPDVLDLIPDDGTLWERGPLERLAGRRPADGLPARGLLAADGHPARRDLLEQLWSSGEAPWKVWA